MILTESIVDNLNNHVFFTHTQNIFIPPLMDSTHFLLKLYKLLLQASRKTDHEIFLSALAVSRSSEKGNERKGSR